MSNNKDKKIFNLVKACKDCPFKKGMSYLSEHSVLERINAVKNHDSNFICHKTINYDSYNELKEITDEINDEVEYLVSKNCSHDEIRNQKMKLAEEYGLQEAFEKYSTTKNDEMFCAGMLILAKKEGFLLNNRGLRFAVQNEILDLNQFIDEDEVFDSIEEATRSHGQI